MNLDTLPCEIVTRCFSYLSTKLLISILQLENIPENIFQAVAENCNNLWYSKQIRGANKQRIEGIEAHYETDFDQFLRIREIIEKKSPQCPLWFHCTWENIHKMHQTLDEINFVYNNQKLGIHVDLKDLTFRDYPLFSDHDINLKITSLSLDVHFASCLDLNSFPKLETFYGKECEIIVDYAHPSLKNLYLSHGIFSTLPVNLKKLVAQDCTIIMNEHHPKLETLRELIIEDARAPHNCTLLLQVLWNRNLKTFSCTGLHPSDTTEVHSMIGPKVTNLGLDDSHPSTLLPYLVSFDGTDLNNMANFIHVSSLTLRQPWGDINDCQLPPNLLELILELPSGKISSLKFPLNLLKLSITNGKFEDLSNFNFPPGIVDLNIEACHINLASGCLKPSLPARLKRLSLQANSLSSFRAVLPCCEYLSLSYNELTEVQIEAPVLELLDLTKNQLTSIPRLPACLQVLILRENKLAISQMSELPSSIKLLDL